MTVTFSRIGGSSISRNEGLENAEGSHFRRRLSGSSFSRSVASAGLMRSPAKWKSKSRHEIWGVVSRRDPETTGVWHLFCADCREIVSHLWSSVSGDCG